MHFVMITCLLYRVPREKLEMIFMSESFWTNTCGIYTITVIGSVSVMVHTIDSARFLTSSGAVTVLVVYVIFVTDHIVVFTEY